MLVDPSEVMADLVALSRWYQQVTPCHPLIPLNGKVPAKPGWTDGPRKDPKVWEGYLAGWPGNVGVVGGIWRNGLYGNVLDIDSRKHPEAKDSLRDLVALGFPLYTPTTLTGGGPGEHLWFQTREELGTGSLAEYPGIDLRGAGGQWAVPYSLHPETLERYCFEWGYQVGDLELAVVEAEPVLAVLRQVGRSGNLPARELTAADEEAVNLLLALGGHSPSVRKGYVEVTRPGKERSAGTSAIVGYLGPGVVKVWTPNWPGLPAGVYDLRQLRALAGRASSGERIRAALDTGRPEVPRVPQLAELPPLRLTRASEVVPKAVDWLWPGRIPRGVLTMLEGDPGLGKSTLALDVASVVTRGSLFPDHVAAPLGHVLILSAEDDPAMVMVPRLQAAGAKLELVSFVDGRPLFRDGKEELEPVQLPAHLPELEAMITSQEIVLVVVDVLSAYVRMRGDSYRDGDMRAEVMAPLAALASRTGCALVLLRHLTKSRGTNAVLAGGGSIAIAGAARSVLLVAPHPEDETKRVLAVSKSNLAPHPAALAFQLAPATNLPEGVSAAVVSWLGSVDLSSGELLAASHKAAPDPEETVERAEAWELLSTYLAEGAAPSKPLRALVEASEHLSWRTVERVRKAHGVRAFQRWDSETATSSWWLEIPPPNVADPDRQEDPDGLGGGGQPLPRSDPRQPPDSTPGRLIPGYGGQTQTVGGLDAYPTTDSEEEPHAH